ncbi:MAG: nitrite reductase, copper-containing, partial [Anaerolineae bacterium]|nr:nitrite reductase, copper-containing [Anaerolineae bacterium]
GGAIDGATNPTLQVKVGDVVQVTLVNGDGAEHDVSFPDFNATSDRVVTKDASSVIVFRADKKGEFSYFCTVLGHRQAGMEGRLVVGEEGEVTAAAEGQSVVRDPTDLPSPVGARAPQSLRVDLETLEVEGRLADGTTYNFWTFGGKVPGPFLRVRIGDTVELHLKNAANSRMIHSIDLHAVTGPGGGAAVMQVPPGQERSFTFKALNPGLYVYHCATPMVAHHVANGMYGLILVEPEGGLAPVDREFYVMQGEIYTNGPLGQHGHQEFSVEKLLAEAPEYFILNGAALALATEHPLHAKVGETVRIFFGVGGPNFTSSFHVIGEIFDRVYDQASLTAAPLTDVQTTLVPPGGATMVEFKLDVPGRYILVDHALSRLERGLAGYLLVEGADNPDVFRGEPSPGSGH